MKISEEIIENVVQGKIENGCLVISLNGHVDSTNASAVENDIQVLCNDYSGKDIVVDAENLSYISSAGLRVLLRLHKSCGGLKVINVSSEVYEILDMTAFTEIMHIEKAYRKLTVKGCEIIGQGANGAVYRLDPDTIVKVYKNPDSLEDIHRERELARKAFILGIPTAIPYDVVKVDDKYGSVFELLNAQSFSKLIFENQDKVMDYIKLYAELLKKMHSTTLKPGELPDMNVKFLKRIDDLKEVLPSDQWNKLHKLISEISTNYHMLHGDFHTKNIMMQNDEVLLIDMDTLSVGNPVYEFGFMHNAYVSFDELLPDDEKGAFLGLNKELVDKIWNETVKIYFDTNDEKRINEINEKSMVIAYARILQHNIVRFKDTDYQKKVIKHCCEKLAYLLSRVDSLEF